MESPKVPVELYALAGAFSKSGAILYAVGGLLRNALLNIPASDIDLCSKLLPAEVKALCDELGYKTTMSAPEFGSIIIHTGCKSFEHTTFRRDTYLKGGRHRPKEVSFLGTLEEDAFRRDFTCNALYMDILTGRYIDPTGAIDDINRRIVRTTSKVPSEIMRADGLRVMRLVRFACELGFMIDDATFKSAKENAACLIDIAPERIREELSKILLSDIRYKALTEEGDSPVLRGLELLLELGALKLIIPELTEGENVPQRPQFHAYDVLRHNMHACAYIEPTLLLRLAALLHDVGKPAALREKGLSREAGGYKELPIGLVEKRTTPMLHHDSLGVPIAREILTRLRFNNSLIEEVLFLIEHHMFDLNFQARDSKLRSRFASFGYERSLGLIKLREADVLGSGLAPKGFRAHRWLSTLEQMKADGAPFSLAELNCTGKDIMQWLQISESKEVGEVLKHLFAHAAINPKDNNPLTLMRLAKGFAKGKML